jgi:hypothetical protein
VGGEPGGGVALLGWAQGDGRFGGQSPEVNGGGFVEGKDAEAIDYWCKGFGDAGRAQAVGVGFDGGPDGDADSRLEVGRVSADAGEVDGDLDVVRDHRGRIGAGWLSCVKYAAKARGREGGREEDVRRGCRFAPIFAVWRVAAA